MHILTVIGARPQYVKAAMVSAAISRTEDMREIVVDTGQHYDANLSNVFVADMEMDEPHVNLGIGSGSHGVQTARMLTALEPLVKHMDPDVVVVYGDTNSTLAGMLAATKLSYPVAHIEAGLRSFNRHMPEEINRVLTDHGSELLFAPTAHAVENLRREGIAGDQVVLSGDVMYDASLHFGDIARRASKILTRLGLKGQDYVLATCHRAENTDAVSRLRAIFDALTMIASEIPVVLPLHPRTRRAVEQFGIDLPDPGSGFIVTEPVGFLDMIMLESHAAVIVTDSGGVQKEAFFYGVPCVTLRTETEWEELVELGWNTLAFPDHGEQVAAAIRSALERGGGRQDMRPYGSGASAEVIVQAIAARFGS